MSTFINLFIKIQIIKWITLMPQWKYIIVIIITITIHYIYHFWDTFFMQILIFNMYIQYMFIF